MSIKVPADTSELDALFKDLEKFTANIHGKKGYPQNPVRNAARAMAKVTLQEAEKLAPVDTGTLAGALQIKPLSVRYRDQATRVGNSKEYFFVGAEVRKSRAYYITPLELGWTRENARYDGSHFILKAAQRTAAEAQQTFVQRLRKDIDKIATKIHREAQLRS